MAALWRRLGWVLLVVVTVGTAVVAGQAFFARLTSPWLSAPSVPHVAQMPPLRTPPFRCNSVLIFGKKSSIQ